VLRCVGRAQSGKTPLHNAAQNGHASVITLLLECGADKEAKNDVRRAAHAHARLRPFRSS
jgi:ankyrin repeat protein